MGWPVSSEAEVLDPGQVTQWLTALDVIEPQTANRLFELLYDDLRRLARSHMRREHSAPTLSATALAHEAWFRLAEQTPKLHSSEACTMRQEVIVPFGPGGRCEVALPAGESLPASDEARRWLDEQFVANDCEPLRASGKLLIADKVLVLATTVGERRFADDPAWAQAYARATLGALARPLVRVDVAGDAVSY